MAVHGDVSPAKPRGPLMVPRGFVLRSLAQDTGKQTGNIALIGLLAVRGRGHRGDMTRFIEEPGPGAGFATHTDMLPYEWGPESFFLGETAPEIGGYPSFAVGIEDDRGLFIVAGSGGGKGRDVLINNLIGWPGGAFCLDVKGELASITGIRRGSKDAARGTGSTVRNFLGQDVAILDPMGDVKGPASACRTGYNPLAELDPDSPSYVSDVRAIRSGLVVQETGAGAHFTEMASILIGGVIDVVKVCAKPSQHNLMMVKNILQSEKLDGFLAKGAGRPLVEQARTALRKAGGNESGAFFTTLLRQLEWLADPRMQACVMDKSGFSLVRTIQGGGTVYVCLPPDEMSTHKRWLRTMLGMGLRAKIRQGVHAQQSRQTLFVVDEMPVLGPFDLLEEGVGYLRGYGVKTVAVVQNIGQLKELYNRNWQTFLGNTASIVAFSMNDDETARYVSQRLGSYEFMEESASTQESESFPEWTGKRGLLFEREKVKDYEAHGGKNVSRSTTTARKTEAVLRPEQVQQRTSRDTMRMIVIPADGRPMLLQRVHYDERFPPGSGWYDSGETIRAIESALAGRRLIR